MESVYSFLIFIVVMTSLAVLFVVALVIMLEIKVNRIMIKLDEVTTDIRNFIDRGPEKSE